MLPIYKDIKEDLRLFRRQFELKGYQFESKGLWWINLRGGQMKTEVYPGVYQGSDTFNNLKVRLYSKLTQAFQGEAASEEYTGDFSKLLVDFGYPADLAPYAPMNNTSFRENLGCKNPTAADIDLFRRLVDKVVSAGELEPIKHRDISSSGLPHFVKGQNYKKSVALVYYGNRHNFMELKNGILGKNKDYCIRNQVYPAFSQGTRKHSVKTEYVAGVCKSKKVREYYDPASLEKNVLKIREVNFEHPNDKRLVCYDVRSMYAAPVNANIACQIVNNFAMHGLKAIADGVNYKGEVDTQSRLKNWLAQGGSVMSLDKAKFGESFCMQLMPILFDRLKDSVVGDLSEIAADMMDWPAVYRNLDRDIYNPFATYNPWKVLSAEYRYQSSFKSGHGMVAFLGKLLGVFDCILMAKSIIGEDFDMETFLQNRYDKFKYMNSGDDTLIYYKDVSEDELDQALKNTLHKNEIEELTLYLGYFYNKSGEVKVDICRFVEHLVNIEHGIRTKTAPAIGFKARCAIYSGNTYFNEVLSIVDSCFKEELDFDLKRYYEKANAEEIKLLSMASKPGDIEFLINPDVLEYRYDETDVSEDLIRLFYNRTTPSEYKPSLSM